MNQKNQRGLKASSYMYVIKKKSYKGHPKHQRSSRKAIITQLEIHMYLQLFNHNYLKLCKNFYKEFKQTGKISVCTLRYEVS